jgi:hypothetical protein
MTRHKILHFPLTSIVRGEDHWVYNFFKKKLFKITNIEKIYFLKLRLDGLKNNNFMIFFYIDKKSTICPPEFFFFFFFL